MVRPNMDDLARIAATTRMLGSFPLALWAVVNR
jgi:hypothetical protein